jgi:fatty acid/phospholipid biosynthesis enzyme
VVKSHGGTDDLGFSFAVNVAADMVENDLVERIIKGMELAPHEHHEAEIPAAAVASGKS